MTNEQAKREIDSLDYYLQNHTDDYGEESHTAMMMAIEALEQKLCEDCISKQAVLDGVDRYIYKSQSTGTQDDFYSFAELVVKQLPSVTPQPKTGHWIDIMVGDMPAQACDQCNTFYPLAYTGGGHKYCPNCGARMEVRE